MLKKLTITRISRIQREGANGIFTAIGIQVNEMGDKWINGFGNTENSAWKEGDIIEITLEKVTKGDKEFLNFKMSQTDQLNSQPIKTANLTQNDFAVINSKLDRILKFVDNKPETPSSDIKTEGEINVSDIPF